MAGRRRGADALVAALRRGGVDTVFSLSGNHIMPVYDALYGSGIEVVHVRQEAAAVHMAEAHARLTGGVGVALVTGGQGHSNAVAALPTPLASETPVLLLSGHAPRGELGLGAFQEMPQAALAAPLCKASAMAGGAAALAEEVAAAMRIARTGRPGPVHLSLPTDVLEAAADPDALPDAATFEAAVTPLGAATAALVLRAVAAARRPLVLAGPALCTSHGRRKLARLRAALGVPVASMESPRGLNDPALGAFAEVLAQADLVVLLGKALDFTLRFGRAPAVDLACRWVVLEPDAALLARAGRGLGERLLLAATAGPFEAVAALAAAAAGGGHEDWKAEVEAAVTYRPGAWDALPATGPIHPAVLCRAVRPLLQAEGAVLVSDGGEVGQWAQACLSASERIINGVAGAIGPAIPFAIGAKRARPAAPVVAVLGDGTFGFHAAEFDTAARHGLPFVAVVGNDARWNAEYQIQQREYGAARAHGCALTPGTRYDLVATGYGGHGEFVERAEELPAALARAVASGKPACVNAVMQGQPAPVVRRG